MTLFLVNWTDPELRTLHSAHLCRGIETDDRFETVEFRLADPREAGRYRVVGHENTVDRR